MQKESGGARIKNLLDKVFLLVMTVGALISVILFAIGYLIPNDLLGDILKQVGAVVAGAVIAGLIQVRILGDFYEEQSRSAIAPGLEGVQAKVAEEIERIIPELKTETVKSLSETVTSIDNIRDRVTEATQFMLNGIGVLNGAKSAGIVNIFPNRYEKISGESVIDAIRRDFQAESSQIRLMGISLGDYFLDRGVLHTSFVEFLESKDHLNLKIRALIVHPKSETLRERARWEAGQEYYHEPAFFDSTTFIETDGAARIAKRLCEKNGSILDVKLYCQAPTAFVLLTSRYAFIEAYNYAARGSNVPIFQVQADVKLYQHYESHFERIWEVSKPISEYNPFAIKNNVLTTSLDEHVR